MMFHIWHSWTVESDIHWFKKCNLCSTRFIVMSFFEVYDDCGWEYACAECTVNIVDKYCKREAENAKEAENASR